MPIDLCAMKKYTFILALVLGITSCNNDELTTRSIPTNTEISSFVTPNQRIPNYVYNSDNPYDVLGEFHNEGMRSITTTRIFNAEKSQKEYISKMNQFLNNNGLFEGKFTDNFEEIKKESRFLQRFIQESTVQEYINSLKTRERISDLMASYALKLNNEVDKIGVYLHEKNGSMIEAYKVLNENIKRIESQIISEKNFDNPNQKIMLLSMASIYRFSMYNYMDIVLRDTNPIESIIEQEGDTVFHDDFEDDLPSIMIVGADWGRVGHADAAGGLGGLSAAGVSWFFIEVTWPIVAGMGLGGSIGNSIIELYNQVAFGSATIIWWP